MLHLAPIRIGARSPRSTALNQTVLSDPTVTSPISLAPSARKTFSQTFGVIPLYGSSISQPPLIRGDSIRTSCAKSIPDTRCGEAGQLAAPLRHAKHGSKLFMRTRGNDAEVDEHSGD